MVFIKNKPKTVSGTADSKKGTFDGGGVVIFQEVSHAISGEKAVRAAGYEVKLIAPPPEMRMGCDLAIEINLVEQGVIERLLKNEDIPFARISPLTKGTQELLNIVKTTDFGNWMMVKAGNMKLTYDKKDSTIVNVSGGGCPDVPYLNLQLVGKQLEDAPRPRDLGYTLCAMMLDVALVEARKIYQGGK
jgi:Protein of unknown function (DUF3343)